MSKLPLVAIIGRPNTGKSTLFNRLIGRRKAIESEVPGTTRDHISHRVDAEEVSYLLVDTGGMGASDDKDFESDVYSQSLLALEHADLIIFTVSGREELTTDDHRIVELLRKKRKRHVPVIVAQNKVDNQDIEDDANAQRNDLRIGDDILPVSAAHKLGTDELKQCIVKHLQKLHFGRQADEEKKDNEKDRPPRLAIIGKPNVGKSSIVNAMMSDAQREQSPLLVSPVAGTTRDSTDTEIRFHDKPYVLIDTAGLKKNDSSDEQVERYAALRTVRAVDEADIAVLVLDAGQAVTQQDKRIARLASDAGKGMVILVNKIDLLSGEERKTKMYEVSVLLSFCKFAKIIPCSAETREGLIKIFDVIDVVATSMRLRIATPQLHKWFERVCHGQPLGEVAKAKHITQADEIPPTFVLFVKNPKQVQASQLRYLENRLRETFGFDGTPVRWITKSSLREKKK